MFCGIGMIKLFAKTIHLVGVLERLITMEIAKINFVTHSHLSFLILYK